LVKAIQKIPYNRRDKNGKNLTDPFYQVFDRIYQFVETKRPMSNNSVQNAIFIGAFPLLSEFAMGEVSGYIMKYSFQVESVRSMTLESDVPSNRGIGQKEKMIKESLFPRSTRGMVRKVRPDNVIRLKLKGRSIFFISRSKM
jgi:hypothetical protein